MESIFVTKIASRGWYFCGKSSWKNVKIGQSLFCEQETNKIVLMYMILMLSPRNLNRKEN